MDEWEVVLWRTSNDQGVSLIPSDARDPFGVRASRTDMMMRGMFTAASRKEMRMRGLEDQDQDKGEAEVACSGLVVWRKKSGNVKGKGKSPADPVVVEEEEELGTLGRERSASPVPPVADLQGPRRDKGKGKALPPPESSDPIESFPPTAGPSTLPGPSTSSYNVNKYDCPFCSSTGPVDLVDMRRSMQKMEEQLDWLLNGLVDRMTLTWQMRLREERRR